MSNTKDPKAPPPFAQPDAAEPPPQSRPIDAEYVRWCAEYCLHLARGRAIH
ncbi:MAG TPA: hypothetical protein VLW26_12675 [Steroidobacteraceae bacterium]|nr:hypothetical protein [Steroidobacteraceae bacterium]